MIKPDQTTTTDYGLKIWVHEPDFSNFDDLPPKEALMAAARPGASIAPGLLF